MQPGVCSLTQRISQPDGLTPTVETAIGKNSMANHVHAQDPLRGGTHGFLYFHRHSINNLTVCDVLQPAFQAGYELLCEVMVLSRENK